MVTHRHGVLNVVTSPIGRVRRDDGLANSIVDQCQVVADFCDQSCRHVNNEVLACSYAILRKHHRLADGGDGVGAGTAELGHPHVRLP